jgi:orsellinic acid C2-O-methyltransferase
MTQQRSELINLLFGFFPAQVLQVAAQLAIADHLAGGPRSTAQLAAATGTDEAALYRLLRALVCIEVLGEAMPGSFELTERGELLRSDVPGSIRNLAMLFCGHEAWRSWGELEHSVRTAELAWSHLFGPTFEYLPAHPELNAIFNEAMAEATRMAATGVVAAGDFARFGTVADIGGGNGTLLIAVLEAHPQVRGILFDTAAGLDEARGVLDGAGVSDRCRLITGDFFDAVPDGADAYLLKSVIHDWDDDRSVAILRNCRAAMPPGGAVLVVEPIMPARPEPSPDMFFMVMSDLNMLVCTGGRERTEAEFRTVFAAAGLTLRSATPCPGPTSFSVLEGVPAGAG